MPRSSLRGASKKGTLEESVFNSLRRMIQFGELMPGSRLTEIDLAQS